MQSDVVYCINSACPFKECDKHLSQLQKTNQDYTHVRIVAIDAICRDYIAYLVEKNASNRRSRRVRKTKRKGRENYVE